MCAPAYLGIENRWPPSVDSVPGSAKIGGMMKRRSTLPLLAVLFAGSLLCTAHANAQRSQAKSATTTTPTSYDVSREVSIQGTVVSYTENSTAAPSGAHVVVQTASGPVDVHIGNGRLLK